LKYTKEDFFKLSDGMKIYYKIYGNGPVVVLNHGYGSSHKSLEYVARYLKEDFTCLLYDQRGCGNSDKFVPIDYSEALRKFCFEQLANDCHELLIGLGFNKVFMYGHSMGGIISQLFILKYEKMLMKVALGSTTPLGLNGERTKLLEDIKSGKIIIDKNFFRKDANRGFTEEFINRNPQLLDELVDDKLKVPPIVLVALLENFLYNFDIRLKLKSIRIPVLIFHGEKDETIPIKYGEYLHHLIQNSKLITIKNQKHEINKEVPKLIANYLKEFFLMSD